MPDTPDQIATLTDAAAAGPSGATVDGRSATSHKLPDLVELEKYRANQVAASTSGSSTSLGVRFFNTSPPGAV